MGLDVTLKFKVNVNYTLPKDEWAIPMPELILKLRNYHSFNPNEYNNEGPCGYQEGYTPIFDEGGHTIEYFVLTKDVVLSRLKHVASIQDNNNHAYSKYVYETVKNWFEAGNNSEDQILIHMTEYC